MPSSTLLASVLESAPDAIVIVDAAGSILFASRRITALCGYLTGGDRRPGDRVPAAGDVGRHPTFEARRGGSCRGPSRGPRHPGAHSNKHHGLRPRRMSR